VLSAVLPPLKNELHIDDGQAGMIATAFMIGYFVTSPFFGYLGDRFSRSGSSLPAFLYGVWGRC